MEDVLSNQTASSESDLPALPPADPTAGPVRFRPAPLLASREMRRLELRQADFARAATSQLTLWLRQDCAVQPAGIETVAFGKWADRMATPSCLVVYRMEPLVGVCLAGLPLPISLSWVDRLMGGSGVVSDPTREISELELALLEQSMHNLMVQWGRCWRGERELQPTFLGRESNPRLLPEFTPGTTLVTLTFDIVFGQQQSELVLGFPFGHLEPLLRQPPAPVTGGSPQYSAGKAEGTARPWHPIFDSVPLPLVARLDSLALNAGQIAAWRLGDLVPLPAASAKDAQVHVGGKLRYRGRLGTCNGCWAVELTNGATT